MFYDPSYSTEYGGYPPDRNYRGPMIRGPMAMTSYGNYGRSFPRQIGGRGPLSAVALPPYMGPEESTQVEINIKNCYCKCNLGCGNSFFI